MFKWWNRITSCRVQRCPFEYCLVHVRSEDERVGIRVIARIVSARDMRKSGLAVGDCTRLDERRFLTKIGPQLAVVDLNW
jgi:hypothetical protein